VLADGAPVSRWGAAHRDRWRRRVGIVFQSANLFSELNVLENVAIPAIMQGRPLRESNTAAKHVLAKVGLEHRLDHLVYELSGGEQQRVSIARALVNNPSILFADEPCANLDTENSRTVLELFRNLNRELGRRSSWSRTSSGTSSTSTGSSLCGTACLRENNEFQPVPPKVPAPPPQKAVSSPDRRGRPGPDQVT